MIKPGDIQIVSKRSGGTCENPECKNLGEHIHHVYWKSQYDKADRNEAWNLAFVCNDCHTQGKKAIHGRNLNQVKNKVLDAYLKALADKRKPKENRSTDKAPELIRFAKQRKTYRKKKLDEYKSKNGGLSPSQVRYRRLKSKPLEESETPDVNINDLKYL